MYQRGFSTQHVFPKHVTKLEVWFENEFLYHASQHNEERKPLLSPRQLDSFTKQIWHENGLL